MKGILFKEPLFNAVIEGRKTQTRRIMNPQPDARGLRTANVLFEDWHGNEAKPRYKMGEIVYMKEPYIDDLSMEKTYYKFEKSDFEEVQLQVARMYGVGTPTNIWKNKLFMPADVARYFIKVTSVRAERIADISEEDAIAEGIEKISNEAWKDYFPQQIDYDLGFKKSSIKENDYGCGSAYLSLKSLWDSINAKFQRDKDGNMVAFPFDGESFSQFDGRRMKKTIANPWVWVYEFEFLKDYSINQ